MGGGAGGQYMSYIVGGGAGGQYMSYNDSNPITQIPL